jgi:hypothetical protein
MPHDLTRIHGCEACKFELHERHADKSLRELLLKCLGKCTGATWHSFSRTLALPGRNGTEQRWTCDMCDTERTFGCLTESA